MALPFGGLWTLAVQPTPNPQALGLAIAAVLLSLVVFGLEPALQLTRSLDVRGALAGSTGGASPPQTRRQHLLLRWQVAVSAGLFIIATMFIRFTVAEARHDSGVALDRLAVAVLDFHTQGWTEARVRQGLERVMNDARTDPAVESVSASTGMPFGSPRGMSLTLSLPSDSVGSSGRHISGGIAATPSIFRTLGVPILAGRGFDDRDHGTAAPVVVLGAFTARRLFGASQAVGRRLSVQGPGIPPRIVTVIGIARDTDVGSLLLDPRPFAYLPLAQLVPIPLVLAAFCACYLPASRAANVDPNVSLRGE